MRQAIILIMAGALIGLGLLLPPPDDPVAPEVVVPVYPGTATGVAFCPTWTTDEVTTSVLAFGVLDELELTVAFHADDEAVIVDVAKSSIGTLVADPGLAQGPVPALAEAGAGQQAPGGVVTTAAGVLAASECARWPANRWVVGVGGTVAEETTTLLFHNPTAQAATVSVEAYSEQGLEVGEGLGSITVPPRGSVRRELTGDLRLRDRLVFLVDDPIGAVVPALQHTGAGTDVAMTVGVPESTDPDRSEWFFPTTGGGSAELVLVNSESFDVAVEIDVFTADGADIGAEAILLPARTSESFVFDGGPALRVRADAPVGAAVRSERDAGLAIAMGVPTEVGRWVVVGPGLDGGLAILDILNTGPDPVPVTYRILGPGGATSGRTVIVPGSARLSQELQIENATAVLVEAEDPVTVGWWSARVGGGLGMGQGIPVD